MGCSNLLASITLVWTSYLLLAGSKNIEHVPAFKRSLSNYGYMTYDRCFRAKIPQNNDDDGNSYFHNGAYRYQSALYLAYRLCEDCDCSDGGTSYIMASEDVLQAQIAYTQGYCDTCSNQCARRRRSLKENGGGYEPDCGKCIDECSPLLFNFYEGYDETDYLYCQEAHASEDGVQYYSGPTCDNDGVLTIGLYYDEDCTFKKDSSSSGYGENFGRNTFFSMRDICISCNSGLCDKMEQGYECVEGYNVNGNIDDEMNVCKTYRKVTKEWTYASPKRNYHLASFFFLFLLSFVFCLGSYTYYVRHQKVAAEKDLFENADHGESSTPKVEYAGMT